MPKEILYHPTAELEANYVIDARCPAHMYRPLKFNEVVCTRHDPVIRINLHCPICGREKSLTLTTAG